MIQLTKPKNGPKFPYKNKPHKGKCRLEVGKQALMKAYDKNPSKYHFKGKGSLSFKFQKAYWNFDAIKTALKAKVQKHRCCYCEKDITDDYTLDHFRPKSSVKQNRGDSEIYPGYYWLAYDWDNWFFACHKCNQLKDTIFPLADPTKRAVNHKLDPTCSNETPLLVDLVNENPEDFIQYIGFNPIPNPANKERGKEQIETVKLDRSDLYDMRASHLEVYFRLRDSILLHEVGERAIKHLNNSLEDASQPGKVFSLMMKCNLDKWKMDPLNFWGKIVFWTLFFGKRIQEKQKLISDRIKATF